jgi:uroporphyrin-III C-methyltransferase
MVYGRAGEEVLYFRQHGYESVVIPGLSSAISGPTFAGIPVTQRGAAESMVLCTGVGRGGRGTRLPGYQRERTLILLMGVARLEELVETLVCTGERDHGVATDKGRRNGAPYPRNLPIAIIERASMPDQRVISGTLATITSAMKSAAVGEQRPPGMIVVGWSVLALVGAGDVTILDDASSNSAEDLVAVDERRIHRWLGDAGWSVKEGFAKWD